MIRDRNWCLYSNNLISIESFITQYLQNVIFRYETQILEKFHWESELFYLDIKSRG